MRAVPSDAPRHSDAVIAGNKVLIDTLQTEQGFNNPCSVFIYYVTDWRTSGAISYKYKVENKPKIPKINVIRAN